jgi:tetratricopeptide (TPR) repeat protein
MAVNVDVKPSTSTTACARFPLPSNCWIDRGPLTALGSARRQTALTSQILCFAPGAETVHWDAVVNCTDANTLGAWLAGTLPEAQRAAIADHAAVCDRCHALVQGLAATRPSGAGAALASLASQVTGTREPAHEPSETTPTLPAHPSTRSSEFTGTDRFEVVRRIGAGAMGVVYEVWDRERRARFALKTLPRLSWDRLSLFKNEFRVLRGLSHRNLVTLGELVKDGEHWFFTMELVDGAPFLSWVCPTGRAPTHPDAPGSGLPAAGFGCSAFDEPRLRDGLRQLAAALHALHGRGKVHRDIKPSNVLVTRDGRIVVLDFGLVRDVRGREHDDGCLVGTPAYMAPEQTSHARVGPEVDWYAVGVMLYAALTGRLPFAGAVHDVLTAKAERLPVRPAQLVDGLPDDLEALCMRLLAIDPGQRAGHPDVVRVVGRTRTPWSGSDAAIEIPGALGSSGNTAVGGTAGGGSAVGEAFVGRDAEVAALDAALDAAGPVVVQVRGESGVGKTTLLDQWLARAERGGAVVLAGRCCERESVPYKAIDGVIEALARWLSGKTDDALRELAPPRAGLLARVFPALTQLAGELPVGPSVPPDAGPGDPPAAIAPGDERRDLFDALRALLGRIARQHRLVVAIDDLQWADADSIALLTALLRPPGAPPLVLVIAERGDQPTRFAPPCPLRTLEVGPLLPAAAAALAQALLPAAPPATAAAIASEAGGHPLFVMELALARRRRDAAAITRLEDALARRIGALDAEARAVVAAVGVAGAPLSQAVLAEATGVAPGPLAAVLVRLRDDHLVRTGGLGTDDLIDAYHSRVRAAAVQQLDPGQGRDVHARLAAALERRPRVDPELLYRHWLEADDRARARRYAIEAADAAAAALAFDHAARLYRAALDLGDGDGLALRNKLGAALVDAGRGAEAARVFQDAAAGAPERDALDLRHRAAEQLLRSGHVDAGSEALRDVLASAGLRLHATARGAIPALLAIRARLRLRGLALRRGGDRDPAALARVDACWSAAVGLLMIDSVRATVFQSRMLLHALDAGDPYRASLALALEAGLTGSRGAHTAPRVAAIFEQARALADECAAPHAHGFLAGAAGMAAVLQGRFADGLAASDQAEHILRTCPGTTWERDTVAVQKSWAQIYLGRFAALAARVPDTIREAEDRDDRYLATALRTGTLVWLPLVRGDVAGARDALDEAIRRWSERGFLHQHWDDLLGRAELDLHTGDAAATLDRLRRGWPSLRKAFVLEIQICRGEVHFVRGRAHLRRACQRGATTADGRRLLTAAARDAARLHRERVAWLGALGDLVSAGIAAARGETDAAAALLRRSLRGCDAAGLALHAAVARRRLADLIGGAEAQALRAAARAYAEREQITAIDAVTEHLAPGFTGG